MKTFQGQLWRMTKVQFPAGSSFSSEKKKQFSKLACTDITLKKFFGIFNRDLTSRLKSCFLLAERLIPNVNIIFSFCKVVPDRKMYENMSPLGFTPMKILLDRLSSSGPVKVLLGHLSSSLPKKVLLGRLLSPRP